MSAIKITKVQLKEMIRKAVLEQVDMRSKDGRELKDLAAQIISQQKDLEAYTRSIQAVLNRQKELQNATAMSHKALFARMQELDVKTLEITEAVFHIEEEAKYKRVEPSYKPLYEKAVSELSRFSTEQARVVDTMRETEINLKKAEKVTTLKVTPKASLFRKAAVPNQESRNRKTLSTKQLNEQVMDKVVGWLKNVWATLTRSISSALGAADSTLQALSSL